MLKNILLTALFGLALSEGVSAAQHGIAMHGELKYKAGESFDYVNPQAPIGGELRLGSIGTFDSYNPFVTKGTSPGGLNMMTSTLVFEKLMFRSSDEAFSLYCHTAESVDVAPDRSSIQFNMNPKAKWADGKPITAEDVAYSHSILKEKGRPNLRLFYSKVKSVEIISPMQIKFTFDKLEGENRYDPELPLLIGLMPVLPKHLWKDKDFEKLTMADMIGSGPYKIKEAKTGHSIVYERRPDYWGWDLPHMKGMYNFQTMRFDYYRNSSVSKEAFKAGEFDVQEESDPNSWHNDYNFKAVKDGKVSKVELAHQMPVGFKGFVFNTRREVFSNKDVRQALGSAFDFEWANKTMFNNGYSRTRSYFDNTELASCGQASDMEKKLLGTFAAGMPSEVLNEEYKPPVSGDAQALRDNLAKAGDLLEKAGWVVKNGVRVNKETGKVLSFEILLFQPSDEKISLAFQRNLQRLGVKVNVRVVDAAQFERRRMDYDYDMIINTWGNTLSPGREQTYYWSTKSADEPGSRNYAGVKDPAVDHLCDVLATAKDRQTLISAARALDRSLLWGYYVVPLFHNDKIHLAYWNKLGHPELKPNVGVALTTWWSKDAGKEQKQ